jgi:hypothetical protein
MNERIRELAEQAFFDDATSQPSDRMYTFSDHKMQQFAELIVQECASIIESQDVDPTFRHRMAWAVKQRFGVEE